MDNKHKTLLYKSLKSSNCPNIIVFGDKNKDKEKIILDIITPELKLNEYIKNDITIQSNSICTIFNFRHLSNNNLQKLLDILYELIKSKIYHSNNENRIIIFTNFNLIKLSTQSKLRVIIEKYRMTSIFIIITERFSSIIEPIKSRCLCVRIPSFNNKEKRDYIRNIIPDKEYSELSDIFDISYKTNDINHIELFSLYNEGLSLNYNNPYEKILLKLISIGEKGEMNNNDIIWVKEISYNIEKFNLYDFHKEFLSIFLINPKYTYNVKCKMIKLFSKSEHNYIKSFRSLIHIESLLFKIINLLVGNDEVNGDKEE